MGNKHLFERVARAVDLSGEPIPGKPLVEIVGERAVLIENHCGVISYSPDAVAVKTKVGCICVYGNRLVLTKMSKEQLRICGTIRNVELRGRQSYGE